MSRRLQTATRMEQAVETFCGHMGDQFKPCCAAYMEQAPASVMTLGAVGLQVWKTAAESTCSAGHPGQEQIDAAVAVAHGAQQEFSRIMAQTHTQQLTDPQVKAAVAKAIGELKAPPV